MARVAFIGNFSVDFSSESHEAASYEALGHTVLRIQEGEVRATDIPRVVKEFNADLVHWVQTLGLAITGGTTEERFEMIAAIRAMNIPLVGQHLDTWWGLERETQIHTDPYFTIDHLFTPDGGHDEQWKAAGVNHHWLPPAVFHAEGFDGTPRLNFTSDVAFVGSWQGGYHHEWWPTRKAMLDTLTRKYRRRFRCWPIRQAIRGQDLNDLYSSVKVLVGDSCFAGQVPNMWSDRVPETTGRGGFLIHPYVPGILNIHPDLVTFKIGDWDEMVDRIDFYLANDAAREELRVSNAEWTRTHHTYKDRCQTILETVGLV